jgi:hypothetical protein
MRKTLTRHRKTKKRTTRKRGKGFQKGGLYSGTDSERKEIKQHNNSNTPKSSSKKRKKKKT